MNWDRCEWLLLGLMLLALPAVLIPYWGKTLSAGEPHRAAALQPAARKAPEPVIPTAAMPTPKSETGADDMRDAPAPYTVLTYQPAVDRDPMVSEAERLSLTPRREAEEDSGAALRARRPRPAPTARLTIQAIMGIEGNFSAIVNDKAVRVGDTVSGARVVRIGMDRVIFSQGGRRFSKEFR